MTLFPDPPPVHLGGVLGPSPTPWGTPTSARPGTDIRVYFIEEIVGHVEISHLKLFPDPFRISGWSYPEQAGKCPKAPVEANFIFCKKNYAGQFTFCLLTLNNFDINVVQSED